MECWIIYLLLDSAVASICASVIYCYWATCHSEKERKKIETHLIRTRIIIIIKFIRIFHPLRAGTSLSFDPSIIDFYASLFASHSVASSRIFRRFQASPKTSFYSTTSSPTTKSALQVTGIGQPLVDEDLQMKRVWCMEWNWVSWLKFNSTTNVRIPWNP